MTFNSCASLKRAVKRKPGSHSPVMSLLFRTRARLDAPSSAVAPCVVSSPPSSLGGTGGMSSEQNFINNISRVTESENQREKWFFAALVSIGVSWEQPRARPFALSSIISLFRLLMREVHSSEKREIISQNIPCNLNVTLNAALNSSLTPAASCTVRFEEDLLS